MQESSNGVVVGSKSLTPILIDAAEKSTIERQQPLNYGVIFGL